MTCSARSGPSAAGAQHGSGPWEHRTVTLLLTLLIMAVLGPVVAVATRRIVGGLPPPPSSLPRRALSAPGHVAFRRPQPGEVREADDDTMGRPVLGGAYERSALRRDPDDAA